MKEDFLAVVEQKRFLGREFLTWLVWTIEHADGRRVDEPCRAGDFRHSASLS